LYKIIVCLGQSSKKPIWSSVCVCVCVCVCVGVCVWPPDLHNQSPWAPHFTWARHRARGQPQMLTPGLPPIVTPSEKTWRVKNWAGASKQKLLLGVGLYIKFHLWWAHPNPKPLEGSLDQSAQDYFTTKLWNSPGQPTLVIDINLFQKKISLTGITNETE
jgi:hypothetical protein